MVSYITVIFFHLTQVLKKFLKQFSNLLSPRGYHFIGVILQRQASISLLCKNKYVYVYLFVWVFNTPKLASKVICDSAAMIVFVF